LEGILVA
jgi:hypothetical protein